MPEFAGTASWADWINVGGAFRALPAFNLGVACYLFRDQIARWPVMPGTLIASLTAFIMLGWLLPPMAALVAIYAIALLASQLDCGGRSTLFSKIGFDRWSQLTYSCYMLHIPVATIVLTFGSRLLSPVLNRRQAAARSRGRRRPRGRKRAFAALFRNAVAAVSDRRLRPSLSTPSRYGARDLPAGGCRR